MSGFKALRDAAVKFGNEIQQQSEHLICAVGDQDFEDNIANKVKNLSFITSKLRLVQAKTLAARPEIKDSDKDDVTILNDYTDTVTCKLVEQQLVKTLTQNDAVKALVTTPDNQLEPLLRERKRQTIELAKELNQRELILYKLNSVLKAKEAELLEARSEWDTTWSKLKNNKYITRSEAQETGPLHRKLQSLVDKMEQMRWLISKLVTSKSQNYDWATDPHRRVRVLSLTRQCYTIQSITES